VCEREGGLEDGGVSSPKATRGDLFLDNAAANSGGEGEGCGGGGGGGWYAIGSGEVCRKSDSRPGTSGNNVLVVVVVDLFVKAVKFRVSALWGTGCWRIGWIMRGEETNKGESYWRPMVVGRGPRKHGSFLVGLMSYFLFLNNHSGMPFPAGQLQLDGCFVRAKSQCKETGETFLPNPPKGNVRTFGDRKYAKEGGGDYKLRGEVDEQGDGVKWGPVGKNGGKRG